MTEESNSSDVPALLTDRRLLELLGYFRAARARTAPTPIESPASEAAAALANGIVNAATEQAGLDGDRTVDGPELFLETIMRDRLTRPNELDLVRTEATQILSDLLTIEAEHGKRASEAFGELIQWAASRDVAYSELMDAVFAYETDPAIRGAHCR